MIKLIGVFPADTHTGTRARSASRLSRRRHGTAPATGWAYFACATLPIVRPPLSLESCAPRQTCLDCGSSCRKGAFRMPVLGLMRATVITGL